MVQNGKLVAVYKRDSHKNKFNMKKHLLIMSICLTISCTKESLVRDSIYDKKNPDIPVVLNCISSADSLSDYYELCGWEKDGEGLIMDFSDNDKNYIERKTNNHPTNMQLTVHFSENNSNFSSKGFSSNIIMVYVNKNLISEFTIDPYEDSEIIVNLPNSSVNNMEIKIVGQCSDGNFIQFNRIRISKICLM